MAQAPSGKDVNGVLISDDLCHIIDICKLANVQCELCVGFLVFGILTFSKDIRRDMPESNAYLDGIVEKFVQRLRPLRLSEPMTTRIPQSLYQFLEYASDFGVSYTATAKAVLIALLQLEDSDEMSTVGDALDTKAVLEECNLTLDHVHLLIE